MNSYEGLHEKNVSVYPYNHMLALAESSLFHPKNVVFFNSKLGLLANANQQLIDCGLI